MTICGDRVVDHQVQLVVREVTVARIALLGLLCPTPDDLGSNDESTLTRVHESHRPAIVRDLTGAQHVSDL
jgi:hypothetical protein